MALTETIKASAGAVFSSWKNACSPPKASGWDDKVGSAIEFKLCKQLTKEYKGPLTELESIRHVPDLPEPPPCKCELSSGNPTEIFKQILEEIKELEI